MASSLLLRGAKYVFILACLVLFTGCTSRIADFTQVSTLNINTSEQYEKIGSTEGSHAQWFGAFDLKLAVDDALENAGSEATYLTNARIFTTSYILLPRTKVTVTGDAWAPVSMSESNVPESERYAVEVTEEGRFLVNEDGSDRVKITGAK